jgi:galactokinase
MWVCHLNPRETKMECSGNTNLLRETKNETLAKLLEKYENSNLERRWSHRSSTRLGVQESTRTPTATRCADFVRLLAERHLDTVARCSPSALQRNCKQPTSKK